MSRRLVDIYFSLKDLLQYVANRHSINYSAVTMNQFWLTFSTNEGSLSPNNLNNVFINYIIPEYQDNSCFKVTRDAYYFDTSTLSVSDILTSEELNQFLMRFKAFTYNSQALFDRLTKYNQIISNLTNGKVRNTTAVLKNNDTPQISGSGDTQNDGFTNNVQINTGEESDTLSGVEQLEALKYIEDISLSIAKMFRNEVLID